MTDKLFPPTAYRFEFVRDDGPAPPYQKGSKTSLDAARKQRRGGKSERDRDRILTWLSLRDYAMGGLTDKQMQHELRYDGNTQRPRRVELVKLGYVEATAERRDGSTVWRITEAGREYLRKAGE